MTGKNDLLLMTLAMVFLHQPLPSFQNYRKYYCFEPKPTDPNNPVISCETSLQTYYKKLQMCCLPLDNSPNADDLKSLGLDIQSLKLVFTSFPPDWPDYCEKPILNTVTGQVQCPPEGKFEYVRSLNACCHTEKLKQESGEWVIKDESFYKNTEKHARHSSDIRSVNDTEKSHSGCTELFECRWHKDRCENLVWREFYLKNCQVTCGLC